jgi:hypothetical protein
MKKGFSMAKNILLDMVSCLFFNCNPIPVVNTTFDDELNFAMIFK